MANPSNPILDLETRKEYPSKAAAGRALAYLVSGDPKDQFVYFKIARTYPDRFQVRNSEGAWVPLDDPSAPVGTLRPGTKSAEESPSTTRLTTIEIDEAKLTDVKAILDTTTIRETVDRSFDEVLARAARSSSIARLQRMEGLDLDKPAVMDKAWR